LQQDLLARNLIKPDLGLDVFDVSLPDEQSLPACIVVDGVRQRLRFFGNCASGWNARHSRRWQSWRLRRPALLGIGHALAESMEPDDGAPEVGGLGEGGSSLVSGMRRPGVDRSSWKRAVNAGWAAMAAM